MHIILVTDYWRYIHVRKCTACIANRFLIVTSKTARLAEKMCILSFPTLLPHDYVANYA
jgi:hypothetical protein